MEKIKQKSESLLYSDTSAIEASEIGIMKALELAKSFYNEYKALNAAAIKTSDDLNEAIHQPQVFFERFIKNQMPDTEYGQAVNKAARLMTLTMPSFSSLNETSDLIKRTFNVYGIDSRNLFELNTGSVQINTQAKANTLRRHSVFVTEDQVDQTEFVKLHTALAESYQALKEFSAVKFGKHASETAFMFSGNFAQNFNLNRILKDENGNTDININLFKTFFNL